MDLTVLVDDERDDKNADLIIRNSELAPDLLRQYGPRIKVLRMDNDMGLGPQGHKLLSDFLDAGFRPLTVDVVTQNTPARDRMEQTLKKYGYARHYGARLGQVIYNLPQEPKQRRQRAAAVERKAEAAQEDAEGSEEEG